MKGISLAIVGVAYENKRGPSRRFELALCRPGEPIELRPEPKNKADENAIAIFSCRGVQLGYVTAERAPLILSFMRTGREVRAVFQGISGSGPWVRVAFDGEEPIVDTQERPPVAATVEEDDSGFYPDWIPPDE